MFSGNLLDSLLEETKEDAVDDSVADPVDSGENNGNKDIEADKDDIASDKEDVDTDSEDTSESDDEPNEDDQSDSADDGNDTSTSEPFKDEDNSKNKEKKLSLYKALKEIKNSFSVIMTALDELITSDLPETNSSTLKTIRKKVLTNLELMDDLLSNVDIAKAKTYEDMLVLYNIYKGDLVLVEQNLRFYVKALSKK